MSNARPLLFASLAGLAAGSLVGTAMAFPSLTGPLGPIFARDHLLSAHLWLVLAGFLLPALAFTVFHALEQRTGAKLEPGKAKRLAILYLGAAVALAVSHLLQPSNVFAIAAFVALLALTAAAGMQTGLALRLLPKRNESLVDAKTPLTKGDDACAKQIKFAHFFLPLALLLMTVAYAPLVPAAVQGRFLLAGLHLLLAGYALLVIYGVGHLWIPRFSGVPAIAAGAIKGELHSSMLGLVLLVSGFLAKQVGLQIAGGTFLFIGMFTFMGVLGANIMKNKSKTQRITREFVYIPWTFSGVFWLIGGILLGLFINHVPPMLIPYTTGLRFIHVHATLLAGMVQLLIGWATRAIPAWRGAPPPEFRATQAGFYLLNLGFILMLLGSLQQPSSTWMTQVGALAVLGSLAAAFMTLRRCAVRGNLA